LAVSQSIIDGVRRALLEIPVPSKEDEGDSNQKDMPDIGSAIAATLVLIEGLLDSKQHAALTKPFEIKMDFGQWLAATDWLKDKSPRSLSFLKPAIPQGTVSAMLAHTVTSGHLENQHIDCIGATCDSAADVKWEEVTKAALSRLDASSNAPVDEVVRILEALEVLERKEHGTAAEAKATYAGSGNLLHHFQQAITSGKDEAVDKLLVLYLREAPDSKKPTPAGLSDQGHTFQRG